MPQRYSFEQAVPKVIEMLRAKGLEAIQSADLNSGYHVTVHNGYKMARIRIRHLQYDENYKGSLLPYSVYKIKAFPNGKHDNHTLHNVDFVVGYNPSEGSFACVPVQVFRNQGAVCIHQKEGLRHEYYNSWKELDDYITAEPHTISQQLKLTSQEGYDPSTGSDYNFHRDVMEEDDSIERMLITLKHGTVSDQEKKESIQRFRTSYPKVDEWSRRFDI